MAQFSKPTDFLLKSIKIKPNNNKGSKEIKDLVNTFDYVENVDKPFLSGVMEVVDSAGLLQVLPIQGGEEVTITVLTAASDELYEYKMVVWTIQNRFARQNKQTYNLGLISKELLINEATRVSKPLSGNPEDILKDLLKNSLKTEKPINSEKSKFNVNILANRRRPFDILDSISGNSVSPQSDYTSGKDKSSKGETSQSIKGSGGFLFWETKRGYNFFAVDTLCADKTSKLKSEELEDRTWGPYIERLGNQDDNDLDTAIYESYFDSEIDVIESLRRGKYSSLVVFFNYSTGQYEEYVYKIRDSYDNMAHLGGQENISLIPISEIELSDYPTRIMSIFLDHETWYNGAGPASPEPPDGATSPTEFADWQKFYAAQSIARYELLKNQVCTIVIPGNPEICAGDKIDVKLINKLSTEESKKDPYDPESSGLYLVREVVHSYNATSGLNGRFTTTLRLMRDSYGMKDRVSNHGTK